MPPATFLLIARGEAVGSDVSVAFPSGGRRLLRERRAALVRNETGSLLTYTRRWPTKELRGSAGVDCIPWLSKLIAAYAARTFTTRWGGGVLALCVTAGVVVHCLHLCTMLLSSSCSMMLQLGHAPVVALSRGGAQNVMSPLSLTMLPQMPQYGRVLLDEDDLGPARAFDV